MYGGFVSPKDLEEAIVAQNPGMDQESRQNLQRNLQMLITLTSDESSMIVSSVCDIVDFETMQSYAFMRN